MGNESRPRPPAAPRVASAVAASLLASVLAVRCAAAEVERAPALPPAGTSLPAEPARIEAAAVVDFTELARRALLAPAPIGPPVAIRIPEAEAPPEPQAEAPPISLPPPVPFASPSPAPSNVLPGLGDIAGENNGYVIPPDVDGAVGTHVILEALNNDYQVLDKGTGVVLLTVPISSFWAAAGGSGFFDPKTLYDPIHDRWIVCALTDGRTIDSGIEFGISQTPDPTGSWFVFRVRADTTGSRWADFPCIGFSKNWVAINVNLFPVSGGGGTISKCLVIDYPQLQAGVGSAVFLSGTGFCSSPAATYSPAENTLYVPTHLTSGSNGTYRLDTITGTPSSPVYTIGATKSRGLSWSQPGGNQLPQTAPLSGTSSCGATPCKLEAQDSQIRSTPLVRGGFLYYAQTVGVPSASLSHTAVQWTKLTLPGAAVSDGGRIEDPTATATNGGKWYAYPHLAVNAGGDILLGFTQFSSAQYAGAGYAVHLAADPAGTMRDPLIYQAGLDYYHKDFGTGRNRWGDYSKAQVDPSDDASLWVVAEYASRRVGTNDGTGVNSSRWGTWWANVAGPKPAVSLAAGPTQAEGDTGTTPFVFNVRLSKPYSLIVTLEYQTLDGTAVADVDYVPVHDYLNIPAGDSTASITVAVIGDSVYEPDNQFQLQIVSVSSGTVGSPDVSTATILNDDRNPTAVPPSALPGAALELDPNPSRGVFRIVYGVERTEPVRIDVVDLQGRSVATLLNALRDPGRYDLTWNGQSARGPVRAGVYFVRCRAGGRTTTRRALVAR